MLNLKSLARRGYPLLFFLFLSGVLWGNKLPELTDQDVSATLCRMMDAHASCKTLSPLLIQRVFTQFLEELDPHKLYFLEDEVLSWIQPSEALLQQTVHEVQEGHFLLFQAIHHRMIEAIHRRPILEQYASDSPTEPLEAKPLHEGDPSDIPWATTTQELATRLRHRRELYERTAERLQGVESKDKILKRIAKREAAQEEEIVTQDLDKRQKLLRATILKAFASSLDTHTAYFTPGEASQFLIQVQQRLFGIGVQLRDDLNGFTVVKMIEGGPAARSAELKVHDRIIAINQKPVVGLDIGDAVDLIRGDEGTPVLLTVLRNETESHEVTIVRGEVVIKEARLESKTFPCNEGVIAHLSLHTFYQDPLHSSASDLYEEIRNIRSKHTLKGIILDLRMNSGGVLSQAVAVSSLFITKGIVVSIKDNQGVVEHLRDVEGRIAYEGPLIILTSRVTASAAEIVAQTLQDYGRALVVGDDHTYGKGTFQTCSLDPGKNDKINPKGEFKVTRGRYYTVSGKSPQLIGVVPDLIVPGPYSTAPIGERYAKYPLDTDCIPENFQDELLDLPFYQRAQVSWLYRSHLQPKLTTYTNHLPSLAAHSATRMEQNEAYQNFLAALKEATAPPDQMEPLLKADTQLQETVLIMEELIALIHP